MELEFYRQIFQYSNINSHENPSCGSRAVPWGWTDRQTYTTELIVDFHNISNAPKNEKWKHSYLWKGQPTGCQDRWRTEGESDAGTNWSAESLLHEASRHILERYGKFRDFSSYKHSWGDTANLRNRVKRGVTYTNSTITCCVSYGPASANTLVCAKKCHTLQCSGTRSMS